MARIVIAGPARLDVREILITLNQVAGFTVARRYGARFKAMYRYIGQYSAAGARDQRWGATSAFDPSIPSSLSMSCSTMK
jgi:hypothetical protein